MIRGLGRRIEPNCLVLISPWQVTEVEKCLRDKVWRISSILCICTRKGKPNRYLFSYQQTRVVNTISTVLISEFWLNNFLYLSLHLTGEHIDYCGYSVLPMAIEQNILAAVSVNNSGTITMANINPQYRWELDVQKISQIGCVYRMMVVRQGLHSVVFRGNYHRQGQSKVALLFSLWS